MNKLIILALAIVAVTAKNNWAVLVAGSNGYSNYRHQSDVCHAYKILTSHGMDPNKIIVMAYNDIANNSKNPIKGKMYNKPNGNDVYSGCKIDYSGGNVTPANFFKVLTGEASGKSLKSDSNSNVFIFYSDHGSSGLIAMPAGGYIYADDLKKTLTTMKSKNMFKKLVFYLESCYSGSMFNKFTDLASKGIYAVTAASASQSSYAKYCGSQAKVGGISIGSCLGDEFSCNWMEVADAVNFNTYTIGSQVDAVKSATKGSQVQQYGDTSPRSQTLINYQGDASSANNFLNFLRETEEKPKEEEYELVKAEDMLLYYYKYQAENSNDMTDWEAYLQEIIMSERSKNIFEKFKKTFSLEDKEANKDTDYDCYRYVMNAYEKECGSNVDRDHKYFTYFYNYCTMGFGYFPAKHALHEICSEL
ncbi:MAG: hypothetical protein MJ252_30530 [archaeon]|nr:hypothetical protein [archaeon]